jgi:hypothetical protein
VPGPAPKFMADLQIGEIGPAQPRKARIVDANRSETDVTSPNLASPMAAPPPGETLLRRSGLAWFLVAAAGQGAFIWMIVAHYGVKTFGGDPAGWNDKPIIKGYVAGDALGNLLFAVHVLLAAVVTFGGLLQLVPMIRRRAPALHRWNGRLFFAAAYVMAFGGLWLTWGRHTYLSLISAMAVSINGALVLIFATVAWRLAMARKLEAHRRWAMRAFLVVNGVWFLRVGLMAWVLASGGLGMNRSLSGPADVVLQFGAYLIPLAVLEAYLRAQRSPSVLVKRLVGALLILMTLVTAAGIVGAVLFMWGPYMV